MQFKTEPPHRRIALQALAGATALSGIIFFGLNYARGNYLLSYIELAAAIGSFFIVWRSANTDSIMFWVRVFLLPFYFIFLYAISLKATSPTVYIWTFLIPLITYMLLGSRVGFWVTLLMELLALSVFESRFGLLATSIETVEKANFIISAGVSWIFSHVYELNRERFQAQLIELAATDPLTKLYNRIRMLEIYEREVEVSKRGAKPFSLLLIDLDHFKSVNDQYGHDLGDRVLVHVAQLLLQHVRLGDYIFRVGGEEFCLMLPGADREQSKVVADHLHKELSGRPLFHQGKPIPVTMSIGVAQWCAEACDFKNVYDRADKGLYEAKRQGRNQTICDSDV